jgi:hypothetical protein
MKLEFSRQIFGKYSYIKCHENPSIGSRVVPFGRAKEQIDGEADMTYLIIVFHNSAIVLHNSANAPKNENNISPGSPNSSVGIVTQNYRQARRGIWVGFATGTRMLLFFTASRTPFRPSSPPICFMG